MKSLLCFLLAASTTVAAGPTITDAGAFAAIKKLAGEWRGPPR